jgi:ATP phosphoribosyltransferase
MNGLRPIGEVLASEAVLIANPTAHRGRASEVEAIDTMLSAVIAARGRKYLMMNAPATRLSELERLLPGLESPSVIPLAHEGMIAIHSVVGADDVWGLLPRLKAAGASGILVLPIEKIVP